MIRPRIIPTLLIQEGSLVKTKRFKNPRYLGDPINAIKIFNEKGVDELCILDINASKKRTEPDFRLLELMASEAFMPVSYGGGIRTIDQMKKLFRIGFEKVIVNTAFIDNSKIISEASHIFGSQSVVCAIDYATFLGKNRCYINGGMKRFSMTPEELAVSAAKIGAGEILLYSIDRDGMRTGFDEKTISSVSKLVDIPVIACGGANKINDLKKALDCGADAVAAGSLFCFLGERQAVLINYPEEKELYDEGIYR